VRVFDVIGKRRWYYLFSLIITVPGLFFLALTFLPGGAYGLQFSIDYTGGTIWEVHFQNGTPAAADVREVLDEQGLEDSVVAITENQRGDRQYVLIRTEQIGLRPTEPTPTASPTGSPGATGSPEGSPTGSPEGSPTGSPEGSPTGSPEGSPTGSPAAGPTASASPSGAAGESPGASPGGTADASPSPAPPISVPTEGALGELASALQERFGPIDEVRQEANIGPVISQEVTTQAFLLIILGSIGILSWITFRFGDFRMGATAIVALIHDVLVVVGTFAILGTLVGLQIDALFVTAMLTVIGFSVHDTIVVFDRVRENRIRHAGEPFASIVNHSILQTLGRSINTSMTVVLTLTALLLFGGDAIRTFVFALLLGIVSGTYSSIFNASALLVDWHEFDERRRAREFAAARGR
jgi:preprotein translocase SecF subunit